jgi:hypothetical protein
MFFANRERGYPLDDCPDNDGHNVDTTCGLTMPIPVMLATAHLPEKKAIVQVGDCVSVTRRSAACQGYGSILTSMLRQILLDQPLAQVLEDNFGGSLKSEVNRPDPVVACYLQSNFPTAVSMSYKHGGDFEAAMLANANCGGENVARGMVMGAILGAAHGASRIPQHLKEGLKNHQGIAKDIEDFVSQVKVPEALQG